MVFTSFFQKIVNFPHAGYIMVSIPQEHRYSNKIIECTLDGEHVDFLNPDHDIPIKKKQGRNL